MSGGSPYLDAIDLLEKTETKLHKLQVWMREQQCDTHRLLAEEVGAVREELEGGIQELRPGTPQGAK